MEALRPVFSGISVLFGGGGGGGINPDTGQPYGTISDEIIPQGARFPGDPGSGGIGGGPGPVPGAIPEQPWSEKPPLPPYKNPATGEIMNDQQFLDFLKFVRGA